MNPTTSPPPRHGPPPEPSPYNTPDAPRSRRLALIVASALILVLVAAGLARTLMRGDEPDQSSQTPTAAASGEPGAGGLAAYDANGDGIVYQSGMHPWIVEDEPGQCPVCGMDLQPVPVSGVAEGIVEIDPVTVQNVGVRTAPVVVASVERKIRTTGTFGANERAREAVSLKVGGWVEELYVNAEGDRVRAGQRLLELYSPQLVSTQEEFLLALRNRTLLGGEDGDRIVEAARRRLALFDISPEQIERLEATGEVTRTLTIYAPASGTVVDKRVVEGMQVQPGAPLMEIVDLSRLWLQVDVPERDLGWIEVGTRAVVALESQPGVEIAGRVEYVYDLLNAQSRTGTARVVVPNPDRRFKPGMYATATLFGAPGEARPTVPSEAVIRTGDEAVVVLALGEGRFQPQPVTLGIESDGAVQILDGLGGGETVVTSAQFLLDSEARLAAALGSMTGVQTDAAPNAGEPDHSQMNH